MTTHSEVRNHIGDLLNTVTRPLNVYLYPVDNIQVPAAVVTNLESEAVTVDGGRTIAATVTVLVSHQHTEQMAALDDLVDPDVDGSVADVLRSSSEFDIEVAGIGSFGLRQIAEVVYYGANITVEIIT